MERTVILKNVGKSLQFLKEDEVSEGAGKGLSLDKLQKFVGGYVQVITIGCDIALVCNEEGLLLDLPKNFNLGGADFHGNVVFCGIHGASLVGLTEYQRSRFLDLWETVPNCND